MEPNCQNQCYGFSLQYCFFWLREGSSEKSNCQSVLTLQHRQTVQPDWSARTPQQMAVFLLICSQAENAFDNKCSLLTPSAFLPFFSQFYVKSNSSPVPDGYLVIPGGYLVLPYKSINFRRLCLNFGRHYLFHFRNTNHSWKMYKWAKRQPANETSPFIKLLIQRIVDASSLC